MVRPSRGHSKYERGCEEDDARSGCRSAAKSQGLGKGSSCPGNNLSEFGLEFTDPQFPTGALTDDSWRNIAVTLKIPRLENQSVFDTWTLAKIVRKVEFKLLQIIVRAPGLLGVVPGYC